MSPHRNRHPKRHPLPVRGGIRAQSRRGAARCWWGQRWVAMLEGMQLGARLGRGRSYAAGGQVSELTVQPGVVTARVQGATDAPYRVRIACGVPHDDARAALLAGLRAHPLWLARLLVRELPREVETHFRAHGATLFPTRRDELRSDCSCPDWANPCKHVVAVHFLLAEAFDNDPLLLLLLRGVARDDLLGGESLAPPLPVAPAEPPPVPAAFWGDPRWPGPSPDLGPAPADGGDAPLAQRLGPLPFWRGEERFLDALSAACGRAAAAGWRVRAGERLPLRATAGAAPPAPAVARRPRPRMETAW